MKLLKTKIQKWGNSLAIRIPKAFANQINVNEGSTLDLSIENRKIIVSPMEEKYSLDEFLEKINDDNLHGEIDMGKPVGKEIW